jgi:hypothetical protein
MNSPSGPADEQLKAETRALIQDLAGYIVARHRAGRPVGIADLAGSAGGAGDKARSVNMLLKRLEVPRQCSSETVWRVFEAVDQRFEDAAKLLPQPLRDEIATRIGNALDEQDSRVAERLESLLNLFDEVGVSSSGDSRANASADRERQQREAQALHAKTRLLSFINGHPSLITPLVQILLARADDLDIVNALIDSVSGNLDFVAQSNIIEQQSRIRNKHLIEAIRDVSDTGLSAVELFELGFADILSIMEDEPEWNQKNLQAYRGKIEKRAFHVIKEFNQSYRSDIIRSQQRSEREIERAKNHVLLELIKRSQLGFGLAAEIVKLESQLHSGIRPVIGRLTKKKKELEESKRKMEGRVRKLLDRQVLTLSNEIAELQEQYAANRRDLEADILREDHYKNQIAIVARQLKEKQATARQQEEAHSVILSRMNDMSKTQAEIIHRLITRIGALESDLSAQSKQIFAHLIGPDLGLERQVEVIQFGDRELSVKLVRALGAKLSAEAQIAIAKSGDRELQKQMLEVVGNRVVAYARRYLEADLMLAAMEHTDLLDGICY